MAGQKLSGGRPGSVAGRKKVNVKTHPIWDMWIDEWDFLINAFEGGQNFLRENYLHQHERESPEGYAGRKSRAYYLNYVKLVINLWISHMKKALPDRDKALKSLEFSDFAENIDLKNHTIDEFWIGRVFPLVEAVGMVHVVLSDYIPDTVNPDNIITMKNQNDAGIRDRLVVKLPQRMINWKLQSDGSYDWVMFENQYISQDDWKSDVVEVVDYTVLTKTEEIQVNEANKETNRIAHNLGFVPVITVKGRESEQYEGLGIAGMYDVSIINREVYNISSLIQEFLYKQCFNFLAGPEDIISDEEGKIKLGANGILPLTGDMKPFYVTPPIDPADFLQKERDKLIQEMYRHSILRDKSIEKNDPASGISKAYDTDETGQHLSEKIMCVEDAENLLIKMYYKKHGISFDKEERYVRYPKNYDIKTINDELFEITEIFKLNFSETFNQEKAIILVNKLLSHSDKATLNKIIEEIREGNPAEDDIFKLSNTGFKEKPDPNKGDNKGGKPQVGANLSQPNNLQ